MILRDVISLIKGLCSVSSKESNIETVLYMYDDYQRYKSKLFKVQFQATCKAL